MYVIGGMGIQVAGPIRLARCLLVFAEVNMRYVSKRELSSTGIGEAVLISEGLRSCEPRADPASSSASVEE